MGDSVPVRAGSAPVVAIIGPTGAGKSRVREALAHRGAATVDFDTYSRDLLRPGTPQYQALGAAFGPTALRPDGSVDRAALAELIFRDSAARERLNALVHPAMLERLRQEVARFRAAPTAPLLAVEGALLGQLATPGLFDAVVLVAAAPEVCRRRLVAQGLSLDQAEARVRLHAELGLERAPADFVLRNEADPPALERQVQALWEALPASRAGPSASGTSL